MPINNRAPPQGIGTSYEPNYSTTFYLAGIVPNRRYIAGLHLPNGFGTTTPSLNVLYAIPFVVGRSQNFDTISINVTTEAGAGGKVRVGVYRDNGSVYPGTIIFDSGEIDTTTTGVKDTTIPTINQLFEPGLYWAAYNTGVSQCTVRSVTGAGMTAFLGLGSDMSTTTHNYYVIANTFGALPSTFAAGGAGQSGAMPAVGFRPI